MSDTSYKEISSHHCPSGLECLDNVCSNQTCSQNYVHFVSVNFFYEHLPDLGEVIVINSSFINPLCARLSVFPSLVFLINYKGKKDFFPSVIHLVFWTDNFTKKKNTLPSLGTNCTVVILQMRGALQDASGEKPGGNLSVRGCVA